MNNSMAIFKTNNLENIIDKNMASILFESISVSLNLCYMNRITRKGSFVLRHLIQLKGCSYVWIPTCFFKIPPDVNDLKHWLQENVFSSVWIPNCVFKPPAWENTLRHWWQGNNFSPVWVLKYFCKFPLIEKHFEHWLQVCGFYAQWTILKCLFSPDCLRKFAVFTGVWFFICMNL